METMNHSAPKPKNDLEAFLVGQFMDYKRKMPELTWEQFYATIASKIDKNMFNEATYRDGICECLPWSHRGCLWGAERGGGAEVE